MLSVRDLCLSVAAVGCQTTDAPKPVPKTSAIEVLDATHSVIARVVPGRPCRATVDGVELLIGSLGGGRPGLVAQIGTDRWTGEDASNGTTLRKNDQIVARIHAKQIFNAEGIPIIRVTDDGDVVDTSNAAVRTVKKVGNQLRISLPVGQIEGTDNIVLGAFLSAREASPEIRALAVCQILLTES